MTQAQNPTPQIYIANQVSGCGLDELQRIFLCWSHRFPVALDGPPGVGKTQSILEMARILEKKLHSKSCSERSTESHIVSHPVLVERDGATVTEHQNGPLARAMEEGGIFYGDEFNLLRDDLQKRLNCAFDARRELDRNDGRVIRAHPDFWGTISYNPGDLQFGKDLDDSVADRFIHLHYGRWSPSFKAYVATCAASKELNGQRPNPSVFALPMEIRGIDTNSGRFFWRYEKRWFDFFTDAEVEKGPTMVYAVHDTCSQLSGKLPGRMSNLRQQPDIDPITFSCRLSQFTDQVCTLARTGSTEHMEEEHIKKQIKADSLDQLELHETSTRIEAMANTLHLDLLGRKAPGILARSLAVEVVIGQLCYGQYREQDLDGVSAYDLVCTVARAKGLMPHSLAFNTAGAPGRKRA